MSNKSYFILLILFVSTLVSLGYLTLNIFRKPFKLTSLAQANSNLISHMEAPQYTGETKTVLTPVKYVFNNRKYLFISSRINPHHAHMLDYDQDKSGFFTIIIYLNDLNKFPSDFSSQIQNKTIQVTGKIDWYQGDPNMIITDPDQVQIL